MVISNKIHTSLAKRLTTRRLFYVCRDAERALGDCLDIKNYRIVTNDTPYAREMAKQHKNIILIKEQNQLDTLDLLRHEKTKKMIKKNDYILVFKNNATIENYCHEKKYKLLNPSTKLAEKVENKISQITWLDTLAKYLPAHRIDLCENIAWRGEPFIVQFNHSHTGNGTFLIDSKKHLDELQQKFPKRQVRIMEYITGPVFTNNNIIWDKDILLGNISYQITGLSPFTDSKFATIGNDWKLPTELLDAKQIKQYTEIVRNVGKKLQQEGWKGLFGVDIIMEEKTGRLCLLEINARQPASTSFESQLQKLENRNLKLEITTFAAHIASLLGIKPNTAQLTKISDGAQIIQRVTGKISRVNFKLQEKNILQIIPYLNHEPGSDLLRIQTNIGIIKKPGTLNKLGKTIASAIC